MIRLIRSLLHREYAHLANALERLLQRLDVGFLLHLTVVVRVEEGRLYGLNHARSLLDSHCIWLVYRQECNIYALQSEYIVVILRVARNIDCRATECNQVAAILARLRVEVGVTFADVVGRYRLYGQPLERLGNATR